jgi:hypothetical protein
LPVYDPEGVELAGYKAAWDEATRACGEMIQEIDGELSIGTDWTMEVHDQDGPLFRIVLGLKSCAERQIGTIGVEGSCFG